MALMDAEEALREELRALDALLAALLPARDASRYAVLLLLADAPELDAADAAWARWMLRRWDRRIGWAVAA